MDPLKTTYLSVEYGKEKMYVEMDAIRIELLQGHKELLGSRQKNSALDAELDDVKLLNTINSGRRIQAEEN